MNDRLKKLVLALFFAAFLATPSSAFAESAAEPAESGESDDDGYYGGFPKGGDFTLDSADGPVSLSDYKGKLVLITFGYKSCPDTCPATLQAMSKALGRLTVEEAAGVQGIFVSFDPARDTPENLKEYAEYFHPSFVGLTDDAEQVEKVLNQYGVLQYKIGMATSEMEYAFAHSSNYYVVDREGELQEVLTLQADSGDIAEALRRYK